MVTVAPSAVVRVQVHSTRVPGGGLPERFMTHVQEAWEPAGSTGTSLTDSTQLYCGRRYESVAALSGALVVIEKVARCG